MNDTALALVLGHREDIFALKPLADIALGHGLIGTGRGDSLALGSSVDNRAFAGVNLGIARLDPAMRTEGPFSDLELALASRAGHQ